MQALAGLITQRGLHPSRVVVLVPYAQLMQQARIEWAAHAAQSGATASFVPRFETTMNWATARHAGEGGFLPSAHDIQLDVAMDALTAVAYLARAGLSAYRNALAGRLVDAAASLARVASAQPPAQRVAWGTRLAAALDAGLDAPALALELAVARIALVWASTSAYHTDVLFTAETDLLVVLEGFQSEPLAEALKDRFGERAVSLQIDTPAMAGMIALHEAQDAEDEAQRAAACVLAHLAQGHAPVALIAQDRVLTRRIRAMLAERGVALRDETGWKLSTTRAAAALMGLLRALPWDAPADAVLDWLKNAPAYGAADVTALEVELRKAGVRYWRGLPAAMAENHVLVDRVQLMRESLKRARPLAHWLRDLRAALQASGQWEPLAADAAGAKVFEALRLQEGSESVFTGPDRMSQQDFSMWASQALEAASFQPTHPPEAQVVILPLSQLLGRPMQAVVLPGCDEVRLPVSPEPPGMWTPAQRELLGLSSREEMAAAQRTAWNYALRMPFIELVWRTSESGERLMPSGFVQEIRLANAKAGTDKSAADPRAARALQALPTPHPMPTGEALPVNRLSASAYEDLRRCPYRFFALRQLRLQESEELESELGKREFGNWLHTLLHQFHVALKDSPTPDHQARLTMLNIAAEQAGIELGLTDSEFLPFTAIWPRVREGYLEWLTGHEASGAQFDEGEVWKDMDYGDIRLIGKIDRIDRMPDGSRLVMDYKTEGSGVTRERIKNGQEDTQLAFYAALLADDTLAAAYVNLGEKEATKTFAQDDIVELRDHLVESMLTDMARIKRAAPLPALGEGKACEYCSARGLCRKDFWS
ncbi:MAG: PD-(D/E)XK nuclease family protein [Pseudomonadota bacterium]